MNLTLSAVAAATEGELSAGLDGTQIVQAVEFDSRQIGPGDLFLPLAGARDGHDFIPAAFERGALATFAEHEVAQPHILVKDCLTAFQQLAAHILAQTQVKVIAITGSNGKTTTKDMTAAVLARKYATYKTQGNHNNEIGLPYTVCHMPEGTERLVLEMGMDRFGDIHFLSRLVRPQIGVITLIGESHLAFFGNRQKIAEGKMGMTAGLGPDHLLIAPADGIIDPYIPDGQRLVRFGDGHDIALTELWEHRDSLSFRTNFLDETLTIPVPGRFNATNAMLAAYIGTLEGVSPAQIKQALSRVQLTKNRTQWLKAANGADILSDIYNANPTAMRLMLETFQAVPANPGGRKIAVLADMLELGETAPALHAQLTEAIDLSRLDGLYLYGPLMRHLADRIPQARYFTDLEDLVAAVTADLRATDQILLKGSNGMQLSRLVEALTES